MKLPYFDAHCDTLWRTHAVGETLEQNTGHIDLRRLAAYAPVGQVFALYEDSAVFGELWVLSQQGRGREGFLFDDARVRMGVITLTPKGRDLFGVPAPGSLPIWPGIPRPLTCATGTRRMASRRRISAR